MWTHSTLRRLNINSPMLGKEIELSLLNMTDQSLFLNKRQQKTIFNTNLISFIIPLKLWLDFFSVNFLTMLCILTGNISKSTLVTPLIRRLFSFSPYTKKKKTLDTKLDANTQPCQIYNNNDNKKPFHPTWWQLKYCYGNNILKWIKSRVKYNLLNIIYKLLPNFCQ